MLYDLALEFRKTKLWKKLYDSQLFAVRHSDGTVGYCCVMGMMEEHIALAVYPGDEGLASYRALNAATMDADRFEQMERMLSQNCVTVSFENKSVLSPRECAEAERYLASRGLKLRGSKAFPQF
ncbi:MAG: hypothetical protein PHY12_00165, partial [Eubacteriales bacterium]|nr:hypothetical protein [Eubacteriales bacterium]